MLLERRAAFRPDWRLQLGSACTWSASLSLQASAAISLATSSSRLCRGSGTSQATAPPPEHQSHARLAQKLLACNTAVVMSWQPWSKK